MTTRHVGLIILAAAVTVNLQFANQTIVAQQAAPPAAPTTDVPRADSVATRGPVDHRVQQRTYAFADTGEQMPYALFVSSKVTKDKKNPLIISLHGLNGDQ